MKPAAPSPYRPLARPPGASELWMAEDHLLLVRTIGWSESYRRFYFRDIQAILIVHTRRRLYCNLIFGGLGFVIVLIAHSLGGQWLSDGIIAAIFLPLLVMNNVFGPGCQVELATAVQNEKIPCLRRLRKTRRVVERITPLIKAAQLDLSGDSTPPVPSVGAPPDIPPSDTPPPLPA